MLNILTKKQKRSNLEMERDRILEYMATLTPQHSEYQKLMGSLNAINKDILESKPKMRIDGNEILRAVVQVGCVVAVICHEELGNIITSKAFNMRWGK